MVFKQFFFGKRESRPLPLLNGNSIPSLEPEGEDRREGEDRGEGEREEGILHHDGTTNFQLQLKQKG